MGQNFLNLTLLLESPGEVFKLPSLIGGGVKHQHFPRSLGNCNVQPGLQTIDREARWPQIRYMGKGSFTLRGHKSVRGSQAWLAIRIPWRPFIEIQTPRPYPKHSESESQEMRFQNVLCMKKKREEKTSSTFWLSMEAENHWPGQTSEVLSPDLVGFQHNASCLDR